MLTTHVLLDHNFLELPTRRLNESVVGDRLAAQEDVQHELNTLETQHVISASPSQYMRSSRYLRVLPNAYRFAGISILS